MAREVDFPHPALAQLADQGGIGDTVKVLDFGLVKDTKTNSDLGLTDSHTMVGTPMYMAPETIVDPDDVDGRVDIYALGAVGYFLLTGGHDVFVADSLMKALTMHLNQTPQPPSTKLPAGSPPIPKDLEQVIMRCLVKDREERYADAEALRADLLACNDAGTWTEAAAGAWWTERESERTRATSELPRLYDASDMSSEQGPMGTLVVNLESRAKVADSGAPEVDRQVS